MTHKELMQTKEYWITKLQYKIFLEVKQYMEDNSLSKRGLAGKLGLNIMQVNQILRGSCNLRMHKLIEISLIIGYYPEFCFKPIEKK